MPITAELSESWTRLENQDLHVLLRIARDDRMKAISPKLCQFILQALREENDHRDFLKAKSTLTPAWDQWTGPELADSYLASLAIERACSAGSEAVLEWAVLLNRSICSEMAHRCRSQLSW